MFPEGRALEFLVVAIVALIVVGPKDLPVLLRKLGQFMAKVRSMAAEFRASFDEMARQSELDELRKEVETMRQEQLNLASEATAGFDGIGNEIRQSLADVDLHPPMTYQYSQEAGDTVPPPATPKTRKPRAKSGMTVAIEAPRPAAKARSGAKASPVAATRSAPKTKAGKSAATVVAEAKPSRRKPTGTVS